jgi:hypothetical protein
METTVQLDHEPAVAVAETDRTWHLTAQNVQLMPEDRVFCFKPVPRLEWQGQDSQNEAEQSHHAALKLGDSFG